jgi:4-aminobutyrate aminotransferase
MVAAEHASFRRGLLALGCGESVIRVAPPLVLTLEQAKTALEVFEDAIAEAGSGA